MELGSQFLSLIPSFEFYFYDRTVHFDHSDRSMKWIDKESDPYKKLFCDFVHKRDLGAKLTAETLYGEIEGQLSGRKIWVFGGSTTEKDECLKKNEIRGGGDYLRKFSNNKAIRNFGKDGKSSDYSINIVQKEVLKESVDVVIWAHWINEFVYIGKERVLDEDIIKEQKINILSNQNNRRETFLLALGMTLYRHSKLYRFLRNLYDDYRKDIFNNEGLRRRIELHYEDDLFPPPFFQDEESWMNYSIEKLKKNLSMLKSLSDQHNFEVIVLFQARFKDYYKKLNPSLNDLFENRLFPRLEKELKLTTKKLNFKYIDINKNIEQKIKNNGLLAK